MADGEPQEPVAQDVAPEPTTEPVAPPEEPTPHPLAPGGPRFEEVYRQMKEERDARQRAEAEAAALRNQQAQSRQPQQQVVMDAHRLQVLVDQGQITPMQATDILSRQHAQQAATQTTLAAIQAQQLNAKLQSASQEVNQYLDKVPSLRDNSSQEFQRVASEAYRVAEDMGLPVTDLRVQRVALRAVHGPLERLAAASQARQQSRDASLPHVDTRAGGGVPRGPAGNGSDPLKDVDPTYIAFWEKRGYTREQMVEEAQYIPKGRKVRPGGAR